MSRSRSRIQWARVIYAALACESVPIISLFGIVTLYSLIQSVSYGPPNDDQLDEFAHDAALIVGPLVGSLAAFVCSYLASRKLRGRFISHGGLMGLFSTAIGVSLLLMLAEGFTWIFVGSYLLRFLSSVGGSIFAESRRHLNGPNAPIISAIQNITKKWNLHP